ncbi:hypothetical protein PM082_011760 [Marasmius tenuissimus]|nr:hypothetical protein PM082_011760 [Marasmius tenuissimus]
MWQLQYPSCPDPEYQSYNIPPKIATWPRTVLPGMSIHTLVAIQQTVPIPSLEFLMSTLSDLLHFIEGNRLSKKLFGTLAWEAFGLSYIVVRICREELASQRYSALSPAELESCVSAFIKILEEISGVVKQRTTVSILQRLGTWKRDAELAEGFHGELNAAVSILQKESDLRYIGTADRIRKRFDARVAAWEDSLLECSLGETTKISSAYPAPPAYHDVVGTQTSEGSGCRLIPSDPARDCT